MPQESRRFRLSRHGLVLAVISAAFSGYAWAESAALVDFAVGSVTATGQDGRARPLTKGAEVLAGDRIQTAAGRAQLRFTDGAYVSLQPNTTFEVRQYHFTGKTDGSERGLFGLLRGALRTVTGLIGRVNRGAYEIQTPTATVGIRGTGGIIEVLADGTTRITGISGTWFLRKTKGTLDVPAGTVGEASPDPDEIPKETTEMPILAPPQPKEIRVASVDTFPPPWGRTEFRAGEQVNQFGEYTAIVGTTSAAAAPAVLVNGNYDAFTALGLDAYVYSSQAANVAVSFDASGAATQIGSDSIGTGSVAQFGNVSPVAWGRWIGAINVYPNLSVSANQGYHYVLGIPAPSLPTTAYVPFTFMGATNPTVADGGQAPGAFTGGQMGVDFTTGKVGIQFNTVFPNFTYAWSTPGGAANPAGSSVAVSSAPKFTGSIPVTVSGGVSPSDSCLSGCTGSINGAFFGAGASHAGFTYQGGSVTGAAVFKQ
jgi:hypothetical protein